MEDQKDNEYTDPEETNPESPADPGIRADTPESLISTLENNPMEVHHHAHDPAAPSHAKNWKSYFWEFLMLFLAVFCGFLAEYRLEHVIEHNREKEFIKSYVEDLKMDTLSIQSNLIYQKSKRNQLDSLMYFFRTQDIRGHEGIIYYYARLLVRTKRFQPIDRTIIQLKNSGSLRLIRNEEAADSIIAYQKLVETILTNIADEREERRDADLFLSRIFDPYVFDDMLDSTNTIHKPVGNPPLRSYDASLHQDFAYRIHQLKGSNVILSTRQEQLYRRAIGIIAFLQKEYHLDAM